MPLSIMSMGILFNLLNGYMQGKWIFYLAPETMYQSGWFASPWFIIGTLLFFHRYADELAFGLYHPPLAQTGRYPALSASKKVCTVMSLPPTISVK